VFAANATVSLFNITADTGKAKGLIKRANIPDRNMGWLFHPDVEQYLTDLRDGNGNLAFPELARGLFRGKPYKTTTQIPVNLGTGSNETEVYLVEFSQCLIGDSLSMVLDVSTEASYKDGATLVSSFSRDETVVRAVSAHDFGMRMTKAAAIITGVKWRY
jgi:HK97 family phage major capsid protein